MRILSCSDVPHYFAAGSSSFVKQLARGLRPRGHELAVLCASRRLRPELYVEDGSPVYGVSSLPSIAHPTFRFALPLGIHRQLVSVFEHFQPDLVHIQSHGPLPASVAAAARQRRLPVIGTNHFVPANIIHQLHIPSFLRAPITRMMWSHLHSTYELLDRVTTPTFTARRVLHSSGFGKDVKVISNGIELSRFHPNSVSDTSLALVRQKYGLQRKPMLLSVGRLDPEKNTESLIEILPLVRKALDMQLVIVGTGTARRYLRALVRERDLESHVIFTGYLPDEDLPAMYRLANCFIMAGTAELQGIALMEAMASGLPVIAANALALPELIQHGTNGFLFNHDDRQAAAHHIATILKDEALQGRLGASSLSLVQRHDISHTVDAFEALYRSVISHYPQNTEPGRHRSPANASGERSNRAAG